MAGTRSQVVQPEVQAEGLHADGGVGRKDDAGGGDGRKEDELPLVPEAGTGVASPTDVLTSRSMAVGHGTIRFETPVRDPSRH